MRSKVVPQIHILKVPRLEAHIRIPVSVDIERRRAALQISDRGSERGRQSQGGIQDRRDGARGFGE